MTDERMKQQLTSALEKTAPDDVNGVLSRCQERKGTVLPMTTKQANNSGRKWRAIIAACIAFMIVGAGIGVFVTQNNAVASVISLDVNPSIELKVNSREKVLSCTALNDDAKVILADMDGGADLRGAKLDVAVNAIVGSLVRSGYLDSISSAILISVEDKDQTRAAKLQQELTTTVDGVLQSSQARASVLSQTVNEDAALEAQARANHISTGKAALISRVLALNSALRFEDLCTLSVEELKDLIETGAPGLPIGCDAALLAAQQYAGAAAADAVTVEVDPELDEQPARYEVELHHPTLGELEYWVDAYTGQILSGQKDVSAATTPAQGSSAAGDVGLEAAKAAALNHAGVSSSAATFTKTERDYDDGRLEYEIEFVTGDAEYDYTIDGATGKVLKSEREAHKAQSSASGSSAAGDVGLEAAKAAALKHAGVSSSAATFTKTERDYDDGRMEYEIEFDTGVARQKSTHVGEERM